MRIIGHRGARGLAPENTLAAFAKALECNVDEIEFDVRVTADGVAVLCHDRSVSAASGGNRLPVASTSYKELKQRKADLATLAEAVEFINRRVPVYVEVKPRVPTAAIVEVVRHFLERGWSPGDFRFGSYSLPVLRELQAALPDIERIVIENWSGVRAGHRARQVGARRISMLDTWLWPSFIRALRRGGYELYCFPPKNGRRARLLHRLGLSGQSNNPALAARWASAGLAGVVTDYPDLFTRHDNR